MSTSHPLIRACPTTHPPTHPSPHSKRASAKSPPHQRKQRQVSQYGVTACPPHATGASADANQHAVSPSKRVGRIERSAISVRVGMHEKNLAEGAKITKSRGVRAKRWGVVRGVCDIRCGCMCGLWLEVYLGCAKRDGQDHWAASRGC